MYLEAVQHTTLGRCTVQGSVCETLNVMIRFGEIDQDDISYCEIYCKQPTELFSI